MLLYEINKALGIKPGPEDDDRTLDEDLEVEYKLFRIEKLLERRPLLLNNCLLRQNPNNVNEWVKRVKLVEKDQPLLLQTFAEAIKTVNPKKADGELSEVW